jgi:hypothetical protein
MQAITLGYEAIPGIAVEQFVVGRQPGRSCSDRSIQTAVFGVAALAGEHDLVMALDIQRRTDGMLMAVPAANPAELRALVPTLARGSGSRGGHHGLTEPYWGSPVQIARGIISGPNFALPDNEASLWALRPGDTVFVWDDTSTTFVWMDAAGAVRRSSGAVWRADVLPGLIAASSPEELTSQRAAAVARKQSRLVAAIDAVALPVEVL